MVWEGVLVDAFVDDLDVFGFGVALALGFVLPLFFTDNVFLGVCFTGVLVVSVEECLEDRLPLPVEVSAVTSSDSNECGVTYSISTLDSDPPLTTYLTSTCVTSLLLLLLLLQVDEELSLISK